MKHYTIPLFVPHLGCPCQCSFCNQKVITGIRQLTPEEARCRIEAHLTTIPSNATVEIAFFGGSFTAIPRDHMEALLQIAYPYVKTGRVSSVRISTRPDAIDPTVLRLLSQYGVKTIELGIQSISDRVLTACNRGHIAADSIRAAKLILEHGFVLGGQMMVGLPSSSPEDELQTAAAIIEMGAREARIYPVIVFANTPLALDTARGLYTPLSVSDAVDRIAPVLERFLQAGVKILRIGLCENESLHTQGQLIGGANHPAMGELCYSALYQKRIAEQLTRLQIPQNSNLKISVAPGKLSMAIGQKRRNYSFIQDEFHPADLKFAEDPTLDGFGLRVDLLLSTKGSS